MLIDNDIFNFGILDKGILDTPILNSPSTALPSFTFLDSGGGGNSTEKDTYTVAGLSFGDAYAGRELFVLTAYDPRDRVQTATIGGVNAQEVFTEFGSGSKVSLWRAVVPTGTSGDFVMTLNTTGARWYGAAIFDGKNVGTVFDTGQAAGTTENASTSLDIPGNGVLLSAAFFLGSSTYESGDTLPTYTGITGDANIWPISGGVGGRFFSSGHANELAAETGRTVSIVLPETATLSNILAVSFNPA